MPRIWLVGMAAAAFMIVIAPGAASAQQPSQEGRSTHRPTPWYQFEHRGCWVTTDRTRNERYWDPTCSDQGR